MRGPVLRGASRGTSGSIPNPEGGPTPTPQGPNDETLYLTIPKLGLEDRAVYNTYSKESLDESLIHLPATGFPWQPGANTYVVGHRMGFFGTGSFLAFFRLNELGAGDEITLEGSLGREYAYLVTEQLVVGPEDVEVMNPVPGASVVSLQTCTLPDYSDRLVVRRELIS